jgi:hypothetical protein
MSGRRSYQAIRPTRGMCVLWAAMRLLRVVWLVRSALLGRHEAGQRQKVTMFVVVGCRRRSQAPQPVVPRRRRAQLAYSGKPAARSLLRNPEP